MYSYIVVPCVVAGCPGDCLINLIPEEGHHRPKRWIEIQIKAYLIKVDVSCGCDLSSSTINI